MRLGVEVAPLAWYVGATATNAMTRRSTKPRGALLTIVSLRNSLFGLKGSTKAEFSRKLENWVPWVRERLAYAFPMRKTEVPQLGQTPLTAGFPFLSVTFCGFLISMLVLHFTQYAVGISFSTERD